MDSAGGNYCPVCKIENPPGHMTCAFCGATLAPSSDDNSRPFLPRENGQNGSRRRLVVNLPNPLPPLYVDAAQPVILGRNVERLAGPHGERIVDLTPYEGVEKGVSRRHVLIRPGIGGLEIADMDSTNGSLLNQMRMVPGRFYLLSESNELQLGFLYLQIDVHTVTRQGHSTGAFATSPLPG